MIKKKTAMFFGIVLIFSICILLMWQGLDLCFGKEVVVNGQSVGVIDSSYNFNSILKDVQSLSRAAGEESLDLDVDYTWRVVSKSEVTDEFTLRQNMLAKSGPMEEAFAIYVNEALVCGAKSEDEAFGALEKVRDQYKTENTTQIDFVDNIAVRREYIPSVQVLSEDDIIKALNGQEKHREIYTAAQSESASNIADRFSMSMDDLAALNPNLHEEIPAGDKINVWKTQDVVRVKTETVEEYKSSVPYETIETPDNTLALGEVKVLQSGENGVSDVVATVIRINGAECDRIAISETIITQPKAEKANIGTNATIADSKTISAPVSASISSDYGARDLGGGEFHSGIDYAVGYGANVSAAIGGRVIMADWNGNFGKCVRIDSGDGLTQIYAHLSEISVSEGDMVKKGQTIGKVGNTGRSTGPHLHFEIRKGGVHVDPKGYISK